MAIFIVDSNYQYCHLEDKAMDLRIHIYLKCGLHIGLYRM